MTWCPCAHASANGYPPPMTIPSPDDSAGVLDLFRLDGKVAIVTGASSGLGVAFARALAEAGADVALGARRVERLADTAALVEGAGRRALSVGTDVADPESCTHLVTQTMESLGRVDILVNNAGVGTAVPATRETPEQFRSVISEAKKPGAIALTVTLWRAHSTASARVKAITPPFDAA